MEYDYQYDNSIIRGRHRKIATLLLKLLPKGKGLRILDIGCGNGTIDAILASHGYEMTGLDSSSSGINLAKNRFPSINFLQGDVYKTDNLTLKEANFDVVLAIEVVEHLQYPKELLNFAKKYLKQSGVFVISTPYHGYLKNLAISLLGRWDLHHTTLFDQGHVRFFSVKSISSLLQEEGFYIEEFSFIGRLPWLWKSMVCKCRIYRGP